jgi:ABC-type glycerol-3-phosphate transport system permease component
MHGVKIKISDTVLTYTRGLIIIAVVLVFLLPVAWMVSMSFKRTVDIIRVPPKIVFTPVLDFYKMVFRNDAVLLGYRNSLFCTVFSLLISFILGLPSAYAMARFSFRGKRLFLLWILLGLMIPLMSLIVPFYNIFQRLGMLDTLSGLIFVYLLIDIPFVVWMMGINFKMIPVEIDESARLDGCGLIQLIVRILLPITRPGIASASISCIIAIWNEFLFAMILTQTRARTAPVVISGFLSTSGMRWGEMAAVASLLIIPPAVFGICIQKSYIRGLTAGSIKM